MATPNNRKLSCLFALITSSVLVPTAVYFIYTTEIPDFKRYGIDEKKVSNRIEQPQSEFLMAQTKRRAVVRRHCAQYELDQVKIQQLPEKTLSSIIVDDIHQVMYCQVPKVACTNWRRLFLVMTGRMNTTNPLNILSDDAHHKYKRHLRYLNQYSLPEIQHRLQHYLKFMISREPLERVLSAYRNKFTMSYNEPFRRLYGKRILRRYRLNSTLQSKNQGVNVTFPEFVRYLLDPRTIMANALNEHWIQQHKLCFPCTIHYDFIGQYESLASDASHILHYIDTNLSFPTRDSTYSHSRTSDSVLTYFAQIPKDALANLYQMYYLDYTLFGYPYPQFLKELNVTIS